MPSAAHTPHVAMDVRKMPLAPTEKIYSLLSELAKGSPSACGTVAQPIAQTIKWPSHTNSAQEGDRVLSNQHLAEEELSSESDGSGSLRSASP